MSREFATTAVVGLGTMGAGVVEVMARNGLSVIAIEVDDAALTRGRQRVVNSVERAVTREKLTREDGDALLARITFTYDLDDAASADLAFEAVP